jgi:acyl-CoA synthetase (AMP-forming)/AMP-acid ligase II
MRIPLLLELTAEALPDRIAIDCASGSLTYAALQSAARNVASLLRRHSIDNVAFLGMNTPAFPVSLFASSIAGLPFSPLNYRLTDANLRQLLARLAPAAVIVDDDMADRVANIPGIIPIRPEDLRQAMHSAPQEFEPPADAPSDIAILLFTSGTSGVPKAAVLSHQNLTSYVLQTVEFLGAQQDEATLVCVPPYHIAGVSSLITSVYSGRRIVQLESFTAQDWVRTVRDFSVTNAMLVPTMLSRILDEMRRGEVELPSLRSIAYGGGRMPEPVIRSALDKMPNVDFTNAYGLTETSSTIAILGPEDHRLARGGNLEALIRLKSVGRPVSSVTVEVRDAEGRRVAPGVPGEVFVRGDQVSGEYVGMKSTDDDGWFPTKDLGRFDEDGYLFIDGRLDDVIVRGGENISPGEIEDVLRAHPAIEDVAVVGAPDDSWGERIVAFVVRRESAAVSAEELQSWVRERLRSTKSPQDVLFRTELPYNETGKLLRRLLRNEMTRNDQH